MNMLVIRLNITSFLTLVPWAARPGSRSHHCVIVQAILFYKQSSWLSAAELADRV